MNYKQSFLALVLGSGWQHSHRFLRTNLQPFSFIDAIVKRKLEVVIFVDPLQLLI